MIRKFVTIFEITTTQKEYFEMIDQFNDLGMDFKELRRYVIEEELNEGKE